MRQSRLTRIPSAACLVMTLSAVVSGCSSSVQDALRADNAALVERLQAAEAMVEAERAAAARATEVAEAARMEAERTAEAAAAAETRAEAARQSQATAEAERDAAIADAQAALERAEAAAAAQAVAEAARDAAIARAVVAEAALEELLDQLTDGAGGGPIAWGPRLDGSNLSPVSGAEDDFGPDVIGALVRAARAVPNGASQSSLVENGRTADETSVQVLRDDGNLFYEVTDGARFVVRVPFSLSRQGFDLALLTDLHPGIEPDLSSYPHDLLGMWAWDLEEGEVGVFWGRSPSIPPVEFGSGSPVGRGVYEGDAAGLYAGAGATTKFLADVELVADFGSHMVGGEVDGFRSFSGHDLGDLSVTLGATGFSANGDPFSGDTASEDMAGSGKWGARWSDGDGWTMGGTFGFAADDASAAVLGAFTACSCASAAGGNPDDPVATPQ